ncbi:hypothetical protein SCHPADRAFT_946878 [Schizopora paradoxa]|uniref:Uncharacterized protein n=1 Tax=Schizopora paradoxa TaxID=27342 RepID=A0A0H2R7Q2_9AGAM|nr:hypothetical protein SCHPADRAFT_946878 [Schizopora paradoxa]
MHTGLRVFYKKLDEEKAAAKAAEEEAKAAAEEAKAAKAAKAAKEAKAAKAAQAARKDAKAAGDKRRQSEASTLADDSEDEASDEDFQPKPKSKKKQVINLCDPSGDEGSPPPPPKEKKVKPEVLLTKLGSKADQYTSLSASPTQKKPKTPLNTIMEKQKAKSAQTTQAKPSKSKTKAKSAFVDESAEDDEDEDEEEEEDEEDGGGVSTYEDNGSEVEEVGIVDSEEERKLFKQSKRHVSLDFHSCMSHLLTYTDRGGKTMRLAEETMPDSDGEQVSKKVTRSASIKKAQEAKKTSKPLSTSPKKAEEGKQAPPSKTFKTEEGEELTYLQDLVVPPGKSANNGDLDEIVQACDEDILEMDNLYIYDGLLSIPDPVFFQDFRGQGMTGFIRATDVLKHGKGLKITYNLSYLSSSVTSTDSLASRVLRALTFEQSSKDERYVSLGRIAPSRLTVQKVGGTEFIALRNFHSSTSKVVCNLTFGTVEWSNVLTGERHPSEPAASRPKRGVYLSQVGGFGPRVQAVVCNVFNLQSSPIAQQGESYLCYSSRLQIPNQQTTLTSNPASPVKKKNPNPMFAVRNSAGDSTRQDDFVLQLNYVEPITVYDCRGYCIFKEEEFPPSDCPLYRDELRVGDVAVVAHTIHKYVSNGKDNVNMNVVWIALLSKGPVIAN